MEKRLKDYLKYLECTDYLELSGENKEAFKDDLLIQIGFFQHERLVHLIVTVIFALLTTITLMVCLFVENIALYILLILFVILLVPYIRHYYILENGVQKMYTYYDKL